MESTVRCPICKNPYKVYAFYAGDQSACPDCRAKAEAGRKREWKAEVDKAVERLTRGSNMELRGAPGEKDEM